jgi:hypothetical protein
MTGIERLRGMALIVGAVGLLSLGSPTTARAGSFDCMGSISDARATRILDARAEVVAGGGGVDDCGIRARGYQHIIITGYVVRRSFFTRLRSRTRSGTRTDEGVRVEYKQLELSGFGGPAFALETRSYYDENDPSVNRSVFVHRHGRMLRPTAPDIGRARAATLKQLIRIARVCNRRL